MSKATIICIVTAFSLIMIGGIIIISVISASNWDYKKFGNEKYETNTYEINESFENISIDTDITDVSFLPGDGKICKVVCYEIRNMNHSVAVRDKTLVIEKNDSRMWYEHFMFFAVTSPKITVYLPQAEYASLSIDSSTGDVNIPENFRFESVDITASTGDVKCRASVSGRMKIHLSTGDIRLEGVNAGELDLSVSTGSVIASSITCEGEISVGVSTGKTKMNDCKCKSFTSTGSTGDIILDNVIAADNMNLKRSTGSIKFERCDAAELFIKTSTGDIRGSLLTDKVFITHNNLGNANVPSTTTGGRCEVDTSTGNINITIRN